MLFLFTATTSLPAVAQINEVRSTPFVYSNHADIDTLGDAIFVSTTGVGSYVWLENYGRLVAGQNGFEIFSADAAASIEINNAAPIDAGLVGIFASSLGTQSDLRITTIADIGAGAIVGPPQMIYGTSPNIGPSGAFNGGLLNVGAFNGLGNGDPSNGSQNTGAFNGNWNANGNSGASNGTTNGNENVGAFNGNWNGNNNSGTNNGNNNGNDNDGAFNGNQNGNGNATAGNGNNNGNGNSGNGNGNGNGNAALPGINPNFGQVGIFGSSAGADSSVDIIATANIDAGMVGIFGQTLAANSALSIELAGNVRAGDFGLFGLTVGDGSSVSAKADGAVNAGSFGLFALAIGSGSNVAIETSGSILGGEFGIFGGAIGGSYQTSIGGSVFGGSVGTYVYSRDGSGLRISSGGSVGAGTDLAIDANGPGAIVIDDAGVVAGRVDLTDASDTFNILKGGEFQARGTSAFNLGLDQLSNSGTLRAAHNSILPESVVLDGLEEFFNRSLTTLADGSAGDSLSTSGNFSGEVGSTLSLDAFLASSPAGTADTLTVNGSTSGETSVVVTNTNPFSTPNYDGIPVIVVTGATSENDFDLPGPLSAGFFAWDLFLDTSPAAYDQHELVTVGLGQGAFEMPMALTAAQDIWHQSSATVWLDRQADLRTCLRSKGTPAASANDNGGGRGDCRVAPGIWVKGQSANVDREGSQGFTSQGRNYDFELGYDLRLSGMVGGVDFGLDDVGPAGVDALIFGLMAGYVGSEAKFRGGTDWNLAGPILGAYSTYLSEDLYVDALLKIDVLDVSIDGGSLGGDASSSLVNWGARLDAGYRFDWNDGVFVEPQGMVGMVKSNLDDLDIFGGRVAFKEATSLRSRGGIRAGMDIRTSSATVTPDLTVSLWREYAGENMATLSPPTLADVVLSDDGARNFGEAALGLSAANPNGTWSTFARGHVQFGDRYFASAVRMGLRYGW